MGLLGSLLCFGAKGNAYANTQFIPDELPENSPAIMELESPDILSGLGSKFAMKFMTPESGIDFKIGKVIPDPNIDYKIRITGPRSQDSLMGLNGLKKRLFQKGSQANITPRY